MNPCWLIHLLINTLISEFVLILILITLTCNCPCLHLSLCDCECMCSNVRYSTHFIYPTVSNTLNLHGNKSKTVPSVFLYLINNRNVFSTVSLSQELICCGVWIPLWKPRLTMWPQERQARHQIIYNTYHTQGTYQMLRLYGLNVTAWNKTRIFACLAYFACSFMETQLRVDSELKWYSNQ